MAPIRLIATDLDGTLLRSDGSISARTRDAIAAAEDRGLLFAFVTARPPRYIESLAKAGGVTGLAVCSNGAILYDIGRRAVLHHQRVAPDLARDLILAIRTALPEIAFAAEHGDRIGYEPGFPVFAEDPDPRVDHIHAFCDEDLTKLLLHHPLHAAEALAALVRQEVGERAEVIHSGGPQVIEIAAAGVSKATGLARLCDTLGIHAAEVIAFGDMPNDLPMLGFAGRAVAVANAHREVLAAADEVTACNDEDGVALRIEALLGA
ncbi:MAG TPA: HAD family hydrolase [Caulobacteraceae bacterium]